MNPNHQQLGKLEREIMELVWLNKEPITVRAVFESVSKQRKIAYTTIMTVMGRLVKKGLLSTKPLGKAYLYQATYSKDRFLAKISSQIIKGLISSYGDLAIAHFTEELEKIPAPKRQELLKLLKEANDK